MPELCPRVTAALTPSPIKPEDILVQPFREGTDALCEAYSRLDDAHPFVAGALFSVPWLEVAMGRPFYFSRTTMWAVPCTANWSEYDWHRLTLDNPWAEKQLILLQALIKHPNGRFARSPTLRSVADICAAMLAANNLASDVYDCRENIRRLT